MINKYTFDTAAAIETVVKQWKAWAEANGMKKAVLGMSGGCDSYVCAKLAEMVFGKDNVTGVMMPNGDQKDIDDAKEAIASIGIDSTTINIAEPYDALLDEIDFMFVKPISERTKVNLAPRLRMCTLYAIAQSLENACVVTTGNLSEAILGYTTMWGDMAGDYAPIAPFTKTEVRRMGLRMGLKMELVMKTPGDGLSGKTDEDAYGFTYEEFDQALRTGSWTDKLVHRAIPRIKANVFKQPVLHAIAAPKTDLKLAMPERTLLT